MLTRTGCQQPHFATRFRVLSLSEPLSRYLSNTHRGMNSSLIGSNVSCNSSLFKMGTVIRQGYHRLLKKVLDEIVERLETRRRLARYFGRAQHIQQLAEVIGIPFQLIATVVGGSPALIRRQLALRWIVGNRTIHRGAQFSSSMSRSR